MAIFITGDTHGDFSRLLPAAFHEQRDLTKEDYLILCGDFGGVWDGGDAEQQWLDWLETRSFTTLFVSGNHENYDMIGEYPLEEWHGGKAGGPRSCRQKENYRRGCVIWSGITMR